MINSEDVAAGHVVIVNDPEHIYFLAVGLVTSVARSEETGEIINVCIQVRRPDTWVVTKAYVGVNQIKVLED